MNRLLRNVIYMFAADVLVKAVTASTTFIVARLITPEEYGTWVTLMLVVSYAPFASLGTVEALLKLYPFQVGQGDLAAAGKTERAVFGAIILSAILLLGSGLFVVSLLDGRAASVPLGLVRLMLTTGSLMFLSSFFYYRFTARQEFRLASAIDTARALVTSGLLIGLTWKWRLAGTTMGLLVAELPICAVSGWLSFRNCGALRPLFDPGAIVKMVRIGLPITIIWWTFIIQSSSDRVISVWLLGKAPTGFYGLGLSIVTLVVLLPTTLSRVLYPQVNRKVGESEAGDVRRLVMVPSQALSILIPAVITMLVLAAPTVYQQMLPKYGPGLSSAQILLMGAFFACIVRTGANFLIAVERQHLVLRYVLISLAASIGANLTFVRLGFGIEGIAIASALSACLLATLVWLSVFRELDGAANPFRELGRLYLPYGLMAVSLGLVAMVRPDGLSQVGAHAVVNGLLCLSSFAALLYVVPAVRQRSVVLIRLLKAGLGLRPSVGYSADTA